MLPTLTIEYLKLERVDILMIELEHLNFGFEGMDIEHQTIKARTRITKLFIEWSQTTYFGTSNGLERVHLLVIKLEHPIVGFEQLNIQLQTLFDPSLVCYLAGIICVGSWYHKFLSQKD